MAGGGGCCSLLPPSFDGVDRQIDRKRCAGVHCRAVGVGDGEKVVVMRDCEEMVFMVEFADSEMSGWVGAYVLRGLRM